MIIGLYLINNNSPFLDLECSGRTEKRMQWCVLIADQTTVIGNQMSLDIKIC